MIVVIVVLLTCFAVPAAAQGQAEVAAQFVAVRSSEFDATDKGIGVRFTWLPSRLVGADAEVNFFPNDFGGRASFSSSRSEGLFGVTVGPRIGPLRPFAKLRPGFLNFRGQPTVCILIFPPPLTCTLASGRTLAAVDLGGGIDIATTARTFVRVDLGDRLVRYPGPAFDSDRMIREDSFFAHEFRFAAGAGVRF